MLHLVELKVRPYFEVKNRLWWNWWLQQQQMFCQYIIAVFTFTLYLTYQHFSISITRHAISR